MKHKIIFALLLFIVVALPLAKSASADSTRTPTDWSMITKNGKYIFVMLMETDSGTSASNPGLKVPLRKYPHSGLYKNDGSLTPLWTVDWYAFDLAVSSD